MLRIVVAVVCVFLSITDCTAADSIYLTASDRLERFGLGEGYTFIAPYFTHVYSSKWISITKAAASDSKSADTGADTTPAKATKPMITFAGWEANKPTNEIRYAVSCDFQGGLQAGDSIAIFGVEPEDVYGGQKTVTRVTKDSVFVQAGDKPAQPSRTALDATLNSNCPAAKPSAPKSGSAPSFTIAFGVITTPASRGYLYASKNAFFSDNINVSLDSNGMLSNSDSSSVQQITSILTELAQTASSVLTGVGHGLEAKEILPPPPDPRQQCFTAIANLLKVGPYYVTFPVGQNSPKLSTDPNVTFEFKLEFYAQWLGQADLEPTDYTIVERGKPRPLRMHSGLVAFYPVPARATLACVAGGTRVYLAAPATINIYTSSEFVDPKRDFLTGPSDTFSFNAGVIVGHKYADQSSAKTIVDTITAPIRALVPSVSVQQTTAVQSSAGKPDQTTTTTQTTTGPPKSQ
jgi:hypothetical protein